MFPTMFDTFFTYFLTCHLLITKFILIAGCLCFFSFDHLLYGKLSGLDYGKILSLCALHVKGNHVQTSFVSFAC
jgi:hypothetical protein